MVFARITGSIPLSDYLVSERPRAANLCLPSAFSAQIEVALPTRQNNAHTDAMGLFHLSPQRLEIADHLHSCTAVSRYASLQCRPCRPRA